MSVNFEIKEYPAVKKIGKKLDENSKFVILSWRYNESIESTVLTQFLRNWQFLTISEENLEVE